MQIDPQVLAVIDEIDALRKTRDDAWQVPRAEGEFFHQLALAAGAKQVVEVGTSYGFSGLFWASALKRTGGQLRTIDIDPKKVDASREAFRRAGLGSVVSNLQGDAGEVLKQIRGPIDIAFLDGSDKQANRAYFEIVWPAVRSGGAVLTDNISTHRSEMEDYCRWLRSRPDAISTEVPVGNGVEWTIKL